MLLKGGGVRSCSIIKMSSRTTTATAKTTPVRKGNSLGLLSTFLRPFVTENRTRPIPPDKLEKPVTEIVAGLIGKKRKLMEDEKKVDYKFKDIEAYEIRDREEWLSWRKTKKIPSASMISSFYGEGYRNFHEEILSVIGKSIDDSPPPLFVQKMLDHGNEYEPIAREVYLAKEIGKDTEHNIISDGKKSFVIEISANHSTYKVMATPDMIVNVGTPKIVEIKCPTYGILMHKKQSLCEVADNFLERYPSGKLAHFIQAAFYAFVFRCETFEVLCYFTNGIDYNYICFKYGLTEELKDYLFRAVQGCYKEMKELGKIEDISSYLLKKTPKRAKIKISQFNNAFISISRGMQDILEEESSEDSKE